MKHILFVFLMIPQFVNADVVVRSDFHFPISPSDYKKVLENYNPLADLAQSHINEVKIVTPYKTSLKNIDMAFEGNSQVIPRNEVGGFSFNIDITKAHVAIEKIITNDVVVKNVGGAIITVLLDGNCSNVQLDSVSSSLKVSGDMNVVSADGRLQLKINNFAIQGASNWAIHTESCAAFAGYQQILEEAIVKYLKDSNTLKVMLSDSLASLTAKMSEKLNGQVLKVMNAELKKGVNLVLTPHNIDLDAQTGWLVIQGDVAAKLLSDKTGEVVVAAPVDETAASMMTTSGLVISQDFIQAVLKNMHETKNLKHSFLAQQIEGLKSLLNNRFFQWFLWSDLRNFATNAAFQFEAFSKTAPAVSLISTTADGFVWYNLKDQIGVDMDAPKDGAVIPYMNFKSDVDVNSWITVFKGRMYLGFQKPKMTLDAAWDADYASKYKVSKSINKGFFAKQIANAIKAYQYNVVLPQMKINNLSLKAQRFNANNKWLQLVYAPVAE